MFSEIVVHHVYRNTVYFFNSNNNYFFFLTDYELSKIFNYFYIKNIYRYYNYLVIRYQKSLIFLNPLFILKENLKNSPRKLR